MIIVTNPERPKGLVWLASYPKSGNTWLRMFLYQLMRIQNGLPREPDELNKLDRASGYEAKLYGLFERHLGKTLDRATFDEAMQVRTRVHADVFERMPTVALVKTHNLMGQVGNAPTINRKVTVGTIYIVRDPRDVALSLAKYMGAPVDHAIDVLNTSAYSTANDHETAAELWGSWSEHVMSWTMVPHRATLVVHYEDLLAKPTETFTAIVTHLRQDAKPEQIEEAISLSSFDKLKAQEDQTPFRENSDRAERFFVAGTAGGWRDKLSAAQVERIENAHREQMTKQGYLS